MKLMRFAGFAVIAGACIFFLTMASGEVNGSAWHAGVVSTIFWIGEEAGEDNGFIPNDDSAWDDQWVEHYGGVDDPARRSGFFPADFTPMENPFYCALPFNDFKNGKRKRWACKLIPWAGTKEWAEDESLCKNRWVMIVKDGNAAYAQWEDVGPFLENDRLYVFGSRRPGNKRKGGSGIDVSPAVAAYLGLSDLDTVDWRFVDAGEVPDGPWKLVVTESRIFW
jgi:hypothetical protein